MTISAVLKHCFHRAKNSLDSQDLVVLDERIPNENKYRFYLAEYIEELTSPFADINENGDKDKAKYQIFRKYFTSHETIQNLLVFLNEFSRKPVSEIDQNLHAEGIQAFKNFIRRWENNANGSDLMKIYDAFNEA